MKASLIILCYKNLEYIDRVLKSCFIQDYPDIEIILRDDGSPNFSYENINAIFSYCPKRISYKIIHSEKNEGTVKNYNKAILASSGDIIISCACDDKLVDEHSVSEIMNFYINHKDCICLNSRQIYVYSENIQKISPSYWQERLINSKNFSRLWFFICAYPCFIVGAGTSYRRSLFSKYGLFDENYHLLEDWPIYLKLLENNERIYFLKKAIVYHYEGGISSNCDGFRNLLLVNDDIRCLSYAISMQNKMKLSLLQKRELHYRMNLLKYEKNRKSISLINKLKYPDIFIIRVIRFFLSKIINRLH